MRSIWNGSISFGLVNIPVSLYSGSAAHEGLDLDMLHKSDHSPIRYARVCRQDGKEIPYNDIVKGYEFRKGDYIELTDEDFKKADVHKTKTIDIKQFVDEAEIDIRYFEKPYYLEPQKGAEHAYALLREALEQSSKLAVAIYVLRNRESLAVIKPVGKALVLIQMRFPADLKEPTGLKFPPKEKVDAGEMKMAITLINKLTKHYIAEDWHDTYTEELEEIIEQKAKGKKPKSHGKAPAKTEAHDLMAKLKESLGKS
ncbi:Ku protein [Candidatus Saccharibacteria bacterium]|nr:Ku protein [Candidatus Saccharibacteria bacterium]